MKIRNTILIATLICSTGVHATPSTVWQTITQKYETLKSNKKTATVGAASLGTATGIAVGGLLANTLHAETAGGSLFSFISAIALSAFACYKHKEFITQTTGVENINIARTASALALLVAVAPTAFGTTWRVFLEDLIEDLSD